MLMLLLALVAASNITDFVFPIEGGKILIDTLSSVTILLGIIYAISRLHHLVWFIMPRSIQVYRSPNFKCIHNICCILV